MHQLIVGDELLDALKLAYAARRPVLLSGSTGIGKSQIVERAAKELGISFIARDLSLMEAPDLAGLPSVTKGEMRYATPGFLPKAGAGMLVFEELNRSPRHVRTPALELLTRRALNDYALPAGWLPMACINPAGEDYDVEDLDPALMARFAVLNVKADAKNWLHWAEGHDIHERVTGFVRSTPKIFEPRESNPRAWAFVSDIVSAQEKGFGSKESLHALVSGQIGDKLGPAFMKYYGADTRARLPAPEQILKGYSRHRSAIQKLCDCGNTGALNSLSQQMLIHLQDPATQQLVEEDSALRNNCQRFVADLPAEYRIRFQRHIGAILQKGA